MTCGAPLQTKLSVRVAAASPGQFTRTLHLHARLRPPTARERQRCRSLASEEAEAARTAKYNHEMAQQMGWEGAGLYEYHYERGLYYNEIAPGLFCGTMPRNISDLDYLHFHEGIKTVLNLQENKCFHHWNVDFHSIYHRGVSHGMDIVRRPVMPSAVKVVRTALQDGKRVYVHCTAGLGRAPAVCIAYVHWFGDQHFQAAMNLDDAYKFVTDIRPCGPKRDAIRGATFDLLADRPFHEFDGLPSHAFASLNEQDRAQVQMRVLEWHDH